MILVNYISLSQATTSWKGTASVHLRALLSLKCCGPSPATPPPPTCSGRSAAPGLGTPGGGLRHNSNNIHRISTSESYSISIASTVIYIGFHVVSRAPRLCHGFRPTVSYVSEILLTVNTSDCISRHLSHHYIGK